MELLLLGLALLLGSAVAAVVLTRAERVGCLVGAVGGALGCAVALVPTVRVLLGAELPVQSAPWDVPYVYLAYILTMIVLGLSWTALRSWMAQ